MSEQNIHPSVLARHVIDAMDKKQGCYTQFESLIKADSGTGIGSYYACIKFSATGFNEHTKALVERLEDVFECVYGKRPKVIVYTPHKQGKLDD